MWIKLTTSKWCNFFEQCSQIKICIPPRSITIYLVPTADTPNPRCSVDRSTCMCWQYIEAASGSKANFRQSSLIPALCYKEINVYQTYIWEKFMIKMFQKITLRAAFLIKNLAESVQMAGTVRTHNTSSARRVVPLVSSMSSKWSLRALIDRVNTAMAGRVFPPASFNSMVSSDS